MFFLELKQNNSWMWQSSILRPRWSWPENLKHIEEWAFSHVTKIPSYKIRITTVSRDSISQTRSTRISILNHLRKLKTEPVKYKRFGFSGHRCYLLILCIIVNRRNARFVSIEAFWTALYLGRFFSFLEKICRKPKQYCLKRKMDMS